MSYPRMKNKVILSGGKAKTKRNHISGDKARRHQKTSNYRHPNSKQERIERLENRERHEEERRGGNDGGPRLNRIEGVKLNIPPFKG